MTASIWTYPLYRSMWTGLDWLFPPACGGCGAAGSRWCSDCKARASVLRAPMCDVCGLPRVASGTCDSCSALRPEFDRLRSWAVLEDPVQEALHRLKYRRDVGLGDALAVEVAGFVQSLGLGADLVVPVPLGAERLRERGYNQVSLIARPLAHRLGLAFSTRALSRSRETRSQVGLSRARRRENVHGAFWADAASVQGKFVLLIDDVATTGSTLSSAAAALRRAGAQGILAVTIARAVPGRGSRAPGNA